LRHQSAIEIDFKIGGRFYHQMAAAMKYFHTGMGGKDIQVDRQVRLGIYDKENE
jgi:hypothetical protein